LAKTWNGDFSTGDLSQYSVQSYGTTRVVTTPAHPGYRYAAELTTGEVAPDGLRRIHLHGPTLGGEGTRLFYGNSVMLPASFPRGWGGFQLLLEFFGPPYTDTPPVSLLVAPGGDRLQISAQHIGGVIAELPATRGVWHDFVWDLTLSKTNGRLRVWHRIAGRGPYQPVRFANNKTVICGPTLDDDMTVAHPMVGDYHSNTGPRTVLHAADRAGRSFSAVAPR
jgi:hypothetical protein